MGRVERDYWELESFFGISCIVIFIFDGGGVGDVFFLIFNLLRGTLMGIFKDFGVYFLGFESYSGLIFILNWGIYRVKGCGWSCL